MKIEYNILWIEDNKSWYETTKELFADLLEDLGFKAIFKRHESLEKVKEEVKTNGLKNYDLLLVDYTLKSSETGDKIIEFLRGIKTNPILTDVLFYSSAVENVRDSMQKLGLEGVYTADRGYLESKFKLVVATTIKKLQEVNTMRGLIMAETSDLDELMLDIINSLLKSDISEEIAKYIESEMVKTMEDLFTLAEDKEVNISEKIKDSRICQSSHKAKAINKLYKIKKIGINQFFDSYKNEVSNPRNLFAHVKESEENGEKVLVSTTGEKEVFNEKRCIEIRKNLIKYRTILNDIKNKLNQGLK